MTDCTSALQLDDTYLKALLRRAKCFMDLQQYEDAVHDYEKVCRIDKSQGKSSTNILFYYNLILNMR